MAWAKWLLPVPGGPKKSPSSCWAMKWPVARSNTRPRFIFLLKSKSKLSRLAWGSRKSACLRRRSSNRSWRRVSSSEIRQEIRSMGAIASAWACRKRVSSTAAMPPSRNCRKARLISIRFLGLWLLGFLFNEIAVLDQLADQGIDLLQAQGGGGTVLEIVPDKAVLVYSHLQSYRASLIDRWSAEFFRQGQHALDAADRALSLPIMEGTAEGADVRAGLLGAPRPRIGFDPGEVIGNIRGMFLAVGTSTEQAGLFTHPRNHANGALGLQMKLLDEVGCCHCNDDAGTVV